MRVQSVVVIAVLTVSGAAFAQSMPGMDMHDHAAHAQTIAGSGIVRKVDAAGQRVTLNHQPIAAIGWPAMTMEFAVAPGVDLAAIQPGQSVGFTLEPAGAGLYRVTAITPAR